MSRSIYLPVGGTEEEKFSLRLIEEVEPGSCTLYPLGCFVCSHSPLGVGWKEAVRHLNVTILPWGRL